MPDKNDQNNDQNGEISVEKLREELDTVTNHWKRALADFENYKRRKEAEQQELIEFAKEVTVTKLLPTLDTLAQALKHIPAAPSLPMSIGASADREGGEGLQTAAAQSSSPLGEDADRQERLQEFTKQYSNWQTGIHGLVMQLDKVLSEMGVKKIEAVGKKFDPHFHEAVREVESDKDDGIILEELQSGFELNGKVIRPSQVVISKKS